MRRISSNAGFTLIEMMVTVFILGLIIAYSIPGLHSSFELQGLRGSVDGIAAQAKLARAAALSTDIAQPFHVAEDSLGWDYHVHTAHGIVGWSFPRGVHVLSPATPSSGVVFQPSGRASGSLTVVLGSDTGARDSVTIEASGFVLTH
jgi:prepilin-type N-terminal cleavage/methylation domain-containing protein